MQSDLNHIQSEIYLWAFKNFGTQKGFDAARNCTLGVCEEAGELAHSVLKANQGIRSSENHTEKAKDAVGDISIFLMDLCNRMGWNYEDVIKQTWNKVKSRDWVNDKQDGINEANKELLQEAAELTEEKPLFPEEDEYTRELRAQVFGD